MNDPVQTIDYGHAGSLPAERNKVLRNTYWLLALSMVPTVLGAWLGVATGITAGLSGGLGLIVFLVGGSIIASLVSTSRQSHGAGTSPGS